jgi:LAS superfamily LD-carboxypeptidase LdcB
MLAAASADGLTLGGGVYRSSESQIALRKAHCGTSDYAIYEMSPSSCSPPTARPGQSMHEQGLAIDFTCGGGGALGRSSPCFSWLQRNAGSYGFSNLPSEPWHWSVNGN